MDATYRFEAIEADVQSRWTAARDFEVVREDRDKFYCLSLFPYPSGKLPWGTCATTPSATSSRATSACAARTSPADGLGRLRPAGGKRGDQERRAAGEMDAREHRGDARAARPARLRLRLVARVRDLRPVLLSLGAVAVHAAVREGAGLSQGIGGQLGSGRPDRARQRAGGRRPRLAFGRDRRTARDSAVVRAHHRLCRRTAGRSRQARRLAGGGQDHAGQLDRPFDRSGDRFRGGRPGRAADGLHHASRHAARRDLHGAGGRSSAGRGRRRYRRRTGGVRRGMPRRRHRRGRAGNARQERLSPAGRGDSSAVGREAADLRGQFRADGLWHGRGDERAGTRPARLGVRDCLRSADRAGGRRCRGQRAGYRPRRECRQGRADQLGRG